MPLSASASAIMLAMVLRYAIGSCRVTIGELHRHALRLLRAPAAQQLEDDVLAGDPRAQPAGEAHAPLLGHREVDVAGRPAEAERRRADADADGAVRAVGARVRVGAGNELPRQHETLLGKVEVEDAVARRRVVRLLDAVLLGKLPPDRRLLVVVLLCR